MRKPGKAVGVLIENIVRNEGLRADRSKLSLMFVNGRRLGLACLYKAVCGLGKSRSPKLVNAATSRILIFMLITRITGNRWRLCGCVHLATELSTGFETEFGTVGDGMCGGGAGETKYPYCPQADGNAGAAFRIRSEG